MKISLSWLKEFVPYEGPVEDLVALLTRAGLEVEGVQQLGADFPNVVVAQILESNPHPNADRLSVCRVDDGSGEPRQIVCGAKNYKVGDKVPLALPGAVLPGNFKIKVGKLRGVESEGMMCSARELQLAEDADGLLILPQDATVGAPISDLYPPETVLEVEITPNRPDWLSHLGVAREVAANAKLGVKIPAIPLPPTKVDESQARTEAVEACPFYSVRRIRNVKVGPSPDWLKRRLEVVGLRSINNIVDVTNFVMMELGQPLHAFDTAKVKGGIVVRHARDGEKILALDGKEYPLAATDLVIADSGRPVAIAGVMGGEETGVTESTTDVLLESAWFAGSGIRATARRLDLHSDSSYRFERGVNPEGVLAASERAVQLILELAGGTADDAVVVAGELPKARAEVTLRFDRCRRFLGVDFSNDQIADALSRLGLEKLSDDGAGSVWRVPAFRGDLTREADLIEEVVRMLGIENVKGSLVARPAPTTPADAAYDEAMQLRRTLSSLGFSEARTSTLVPLASHKGYSCLSVRNPLGEEQSALRPTLITGLIEAVGRNLNFGANRIQLFEIGRVFAASTEEEVGKVGLAMTGQKSVPSWRNREVESFDFFDIKGIVEKLVPGVKFAPTEHPLFALALEVKVGDSTAGVVGQLAPAAARELNARGPVLAAELRLDLLSAAYQVREFVPIPKFPAVTRDFAAVVARDLPYGEIERVLAEAYESLLCEVRPFDVFTDDTGAKLPANQKSLAFSLTFRSPERTLTADEVNAACDRLKARLREKLAADFRE